MQICPRCHLQVRKIPCSLCGYGRRYFSIADMMAVLAVGGFLLAGVLLLAG